jgi:hypothetical protein
MPSLAVVPGSFFAEFGPAGGVSYRIQYDPAFN